MHTYTGSIVISSATAVLSTNKTLVRINMLGYKNACQGGHILYLDTKCCIHEDTV